MSVRIENATLWPLAIYAIGAERNHYLGRLAPGSYVCTHLRGHAGVVRLLATPDGKLVLAESAPIDLGVPGGWRWRIEPTTAGTDELTDLGRPCVTHRA